MLLPHEFSLGYIGSVIQLTLVLPVGDYDRACLVTLAPGKPTAIVVDERDSFASFGCENNTSWKGILVTNVAIELDEKATFDVVGWMPPLGMLVRRENGIFISVRPDGAIPRNTLIPIAGGLPTSEASMAVGFKKWQIVIGEGLSKRTLMSFDTDRQNKPRG
jgi:hypothetical protein